MGCAGFPILFVGTAGEVVVVGGHCMRPVEHHCFATIGTNYQSGILVLLIHLRSAALVFPHLLHNIPNLFGNDGRMRIFKHETFLTRMFNFALVLIGPGAEPVVHSVAKIDLIFQQVRDCAVRPVVRLRDVQCRMCQAVFLVGVIAGTKHLFFLQDRRNPAGAIARGTQGEDSFHNGSGFLVYDQLFCFRVFGISIGSAGSKPLAALRFGFLNRTDLSAGVPNKPLVEQVFERHEIIALCIFRIHIVIDCNVPNAEHGEALLNIETGMKLISAKAAEILGHNDSNLAVFHIRDHLLKCGSLEVTA